jgi:hypothetical protein
MSVDLSEICRVEIELQDLASTLRVMIRLSVTKAWPLFREIFFHNPDLRAEDVFGAVLLVVGECSRPFDTDEVLRLLTEKLKRAVQFSRLAVDVPQSQIVEMWRIYAESKLPDSIFTGFGFKSALAAFQSIQDGTQPRVIN